MEKKQITFQNGRLALSILADGAGLWCEGVTNKDSGYRWENARRRVPLCAVPGFDFAAAAVTARREKSVDAGMPVDHLSLDCTAGGRTVTVSLRAYADLPLFRIELRLCGRFGGEAAAEEAAAKESGIETAPRTAAAARPEVLFASPIGERHLKLRTVQLRDVTDANNILVAESATTVYTRRRETARGQLFFLDAYLAGETMLLVKEAPSLGARLSDGAWDLAVEAGASVTAAGLGADFTRAADYTPEVPLYAATVGVGRGGEALERAWREQYRRDMHETASRGLVAMSNTWGDRHQDAAVCESFMLEELACAAELGVGAVQIDDGWQRGVTANSKLAKSSVWGSGYYAFDPDFWKVNEAKFPRGLRPLREAADAAGIRLGLWFSPDLGGEYAMWERDAETLLGLWRENGIRFFKLDGIDITSKQIETRLLAMVRRVHEASGGAVSFNFDITALRRWGFLFQRQYGTIFVENRYTDWGNYYPHATLRTVWMLSRYIPTARLQMELLNLRRNAEKYAGDPLAPGLYGIDWVFASVLFANPLVWMEMSCLTEADRHTLGAIMAVWRPLREELARADVTPLGEEPDGAAFTGLRASLPEREYVLLFREAGEAAAYDFAFPAPRGTRLTTLWQSGGAEAFLTDETLHLAAPEARSFVFLRCE